MNGPRKPPSASPPVQVPFSAQHLGQHQFHFAQPTNPDDFNQRAFIYPQHIQLPQGFGAQTQHNHHPHDMNKAQMAHVSAGSGQSNQVQPPGMMYPNPQQVPNRPNAPSFVQPRQNLSQNIRGTGQTRPLSMASSPGQPMYNQHQLAPMYAVQSPFSNQSTVIIQQPPPMQVGGTYSGGRPNMQGPQYTITTSQQGMNLPNTPQFSYYPTVTGPPPQQPNPMFYTTPGGLAVQTQPATRAVAQAAYTKRERKVLKITDPNTGEEVNVGSSQSSTPPQSGPSSSRATPVTTAASEPTPPPQQQQQQQSSVSAEFATKVLAAMRQGGNAPPPPPAVMQQPPVQAQPPPPHTHVQGPYPIPPPSAQTPTVHPTPNEIAAGSPLLAQPPPPVVPSMVTVSAQDSGPAASPESTDVKQSAPAAEVVGSEDSDVQEAIASEEAEAATDNAGAQDSSLVASDAAAQEVVDEPVLASAAAEGRTEEPMDVHSHESVEVSPEAELKPEAETAVTPELTTLANTAAPKSKDSTPEPQTQIVSQDTPVAPVAAAPTVPDVMPGESDPVESGTSTPVERLRDSSDRSVSRESSPVITPVDLEQQPPTERKGSLTRSENGIIESDDGKDGRNKKSRKQKLRELNQKGDKEGSDMDAFTVDNNVSPDADSSEAAAPAVEEEGASAAVAAVVVAQEAEVPPPPAEEVAPSEPPPAEPLPLTTDKMDKVEDKVAAENKKNEQNSEDVSKELLQNAKIEEAKPVINNDKIEMKYKYREDQWSPLNPEGKKHYDRNFLLQVRYAEESLQKPEGLQIPDILLDSPLVRPEAMSTSGPGPMRGGMQGMRPGSMVDFTPGFIKNSPSGKGHHGPGGMGARSRSQQKDKIPRKVISVSLQQDVKLHTTENAWKPTGKSEKEGGDDPESIATAEVLKKVRSVLNKLTPQKFQTLMQQIVELEINSETRLTGTIDLIFEKAIDEPSFSVAYANMCKCLIHLKVPVLGKPDEMVTFRKLLLNRCQREFEKDKSQEAELAKMKDDIDLAGSEEEKKKKTEELTLLETKARRRSLGNIRFIGELFKLKMLTEGIMHDCLLKLLRSNDEDSLECLCRLLTTVGKELDHAKAKPRMDQYFQQMEKIVKQRKTSSRVRFMLQDVIELRHRLFWVPRREDNNPKTIDQIHKEVAQEAIQKTQFVQNFTMQQQQQQQQHGRPTKGSGRGGRPGPPPGPQDDGWNTVGKTTRALDPGRIKLTKQNVDDNIQLGPGGRPGFGAWGRGSSGGGGKTASQENERPSTPGNRFSALSGGRPPAEGSYDSGRSSSGNRNAPNRDSRGGRSANSTPARGGGKNLGRMSSEQDRESILNTVRSITGSQDASRDSSRNRQQSRERPPAAATPPAPVELTEAEVEKKTKAIMEEFLHLQDFKEAVDCVREINSAPSIYKFVEIAINQVLERSSQARRNTGQLLHHLITKKVVSEEVYVKGLKEVLEFAEDMAIDIPKIYTYLGELLSPMIEDGSISLTFLKAACEPLARCNTAGKLVAEILHIASNKLGHIKVGDLWKSSGLQWSDFLSSEDNVADFVKTNRLDFTAGVEEPRSPDAKSISIEKIQDQLDNLIIEQKVVNEEIFDWIEANVGEERSREPQFIRALMTSVCNSAITGTGAQSYKLDNTKVQGRVVLLQKYLDHQAELELQALYALQALVHKLDHPAVLLRDFFDLLYDEDVISEDAFYHWEASSDPAEQAGKGVARASVVQFFAWLREADEESQEDN